ncbi:hypothetical protein HBH46_223190 [Parastagonospora nodorum]|nr:hypothetical protein HBH46_223190 [Parastagonospora nodorum]KAH5173453.1 hypothetical protein HBH76_237910 [Parastagonospora nodorum]KAH5309959.1 hypothetical protein HBI50_160060 [Parastagonospora nodorum]KAH5692763.1 hypothetical protein HBI44_158620 [Parastagonospora nodorum]KAH6195926.1 hypothetical protein HBI15_220230 [Parastagonospora nodorum]
MPSTPSHCLPRALATHVRPQRLKVFITTFSTKIPLTPTMDRTLDRHEQDKVCVARASFFQGQKRRTSTSKDSPLDNLSITSRTSQDTMSSKKFKFSGITSTKPSDTAPKMPLIVRFYDSNVQARDSHGRTQEEILAWPDSKLESCHNYIQMLFPVPEGSAFNWEAPIIDRETMDAFRSRKDLRDRLRLSFERMLDFYGFAVEMKPEQEAEKSEEKDEDATGDNATETQDTTTSKSEATHSFPPGITSYTTPFTYAIIRGPNFRTNSRNWAVRFDHNHLRITRILRCLRILGLQIECEAFFKALKEVYDDDAVKISERSLTYWTRAVTRPLYVAPDDDEIEWLEEWEGEQQ